MDDKYLKASVALIEKELGLHLSAEQKESLAFIIDNVYHDGFSDGSKDAILLPSD